jgi:hypothetical protein
LDLQASGAINHIFANALNHASVSGHADNKAENDEPHSDTSNDLHN